MTTDELKGIFEMHQAMNIEVFYWWCIATVSYTHLTLPTIYSV